jgi:hypothetical protein
MPHRSLAVSTAPILHRQIAPPPKQPAKPARLPSLAGIKRVAGTLHLPVFVWPR